MPLIDIQDAISLLEQGKYKEAIPLLEHVTRRMPVYVTAHVLLARALEVENDLPRALKVWQRAHFLMPNSPVTSEGIKRVVAKSSLPRQSAVPLTPEDELDTPKPSKQQPVTAHDADSSPTEMANEPPVAEYQSLADAIELPPAPVHPSDEDLKHEVEEKSPKTTVSLEPPVPLPIPPLNDKPDDSPDAEDPPPVPSSPSTQFEDLDRLIEELESARITPIPDFERIPTPDLEDDIDDVVSETLAHIYASQKNYDEAARVYDLLATQHPDRASEFRQKASENRARVDRS